MSARGKNWKGRTTKATKRRIWARDGYVCQYCKRKVRPPKRGETALADHIATVDHVTPASRGGRHGGDNLVTACRACNTAKSRADDALPRPIKRGPLTATIAERVGG